MYSNVEVNLNWAADFPVRFILLAALARLAISISLSLSSSRTVLRTCTSELHDPYPKGRVLISGKGVGLVSCKRNVFRIPILHSLIPDPRTLNKRIKMASAKGIDPKLKSLKIKTGVVKRWVSIDL